MADDAHCLVHRHMAQEIVEHARDGQERGAAWTGQVGIPVARQQGRETAIAFVTGGLDEAFEGLGRVRKAVQKQQWAIPTAEFMIGQRPVAGWQVFQSRIPLLGHYIPHDGSSVAFLSEFGSGPQPDPAGSRVVIARPM
jgi:hypothetical protein